MKLVRLLPIVVGAAVVLFGIYLVGSHGNIAGVNLPSLLGLPQCDTSANATPCVGLGLYGGTGVGTIVAIFGLGLVATGMRSGVASAAMGGGTPGLPPEMLATLQAATARMNAGTSAPGAAPPMGTPDPSYKFCSKCGTRTETASKFCKSCGATV